MMGLTPVSGTLSNYYHILLLPRYSTSGTYDY